MYAEKIGTHMFSMCACNVIYEDNLKVDDHIPEYCTKARYIYNSMIHLVNGSNTRVRIKYQDVQPPKYRKMPRRPKKKRNLEQGETDGSNHKMRRTCLIIKCSRYKQQGHTKYTCKMTPTTQPSQANQQIQQSQANQQTQPIHGSQTCQQTQVTPTTQGSQVSQPSQAKQ